ncbi:hypothetical protein EVAR_50249_1 [Eumeta japonica]|uniref:Uncharacterized protein n=1 Tax=Eumeta variegata TaxID=151549 RepID=A0A4C1YKP6_EUMVA|nr:hypothetical protein EVAR_50249_1 [Eumeta japonica]
MSSRSVYYLTSIATISSRADGTAPAAARGEFCKAPNVTPSRTVLVDIMYTRRPITKGRLKGAAPMSKILDLDINCIAVT